MSELNKVIGDLQQTVGALTQTALRLKKSAVASVNARSVYENQKNQYLLQLKAEESLDATIKRTDAIRTAMYRSQFADERLAWQLAEVNYETDRDLLRALMAKLNAIQSIARLTESELKGGYDFEDRFESLSAEIKGVKN